MQIQTITALAQALSLTSLQAAKATPVNGGKIVAVTLGDRLESDDFIHLRRCATTGEIVLVNYHPTLRHPLCVLYQRNGKINAVSTDNEGQLVIEVFLSEETV